MVTGERYEVKYVEINLSGDSAEFWKIYGDLCHYGTGGQYVCRSESDPAGDGTDNR